MIFMLEKKKLYQQAGKKLVSVYRRELPDLDRLLRERLSRHLKLPDPS